MIFQVLTAVSAVFAGIYLVYYCYRPASFGKSIVKTSAIAALVLLSILLNGPIWLTIALAFCALGDLLLSIDSENSFMAGIGAFAFGHLAYVVAFVLHPLFDFGLLISDGNLAIAGIIAALALGMAFILAPRAGNLSGPVLAYIPIIALMAIMALSLPQSGGLGWVVIGALLFLLSDFTLSLEIFVLQKNAKLRQITPFIVWSTYWSAQFLLMFGLVSANV